MQRMLVPTPLVRLDHEAINLYSKVEFANPFGSIKDRPAFWMLKQAIMRGDIDEETVVIESSSGNTAAGLAGYCRLLGLKFIPTIDPNISPISEAFLRATATEVIKVTERDARGGYLQTRLERVKEQQRKLPNVFWTNQYANPDAMAAHYESTGRELIEQLDHIDYVFIGVSSAGTIAGVSRRVKQRFPCATIVAVDAEGSIIFGRDPKPRRIPGIGASVVPSLLEHAIVDDVIWIDEETTISACYELLLRHGLFVGGSSGSAYAAIRAYFSRHPPRRTRPNVVFFCADRGLGYFESVFARTSALDLTQERVLCSHSPS